MLSVRNPPPRSRVSKAASQWGGRALRGRLHASPRVGSPPLATGGLFPRATGHGALWQHWAAAAGPGGTWNTPLPRLWGRRLLALHQLSGGQLSVPGGIRAPQPHTWLGNLPCERRCWKKSRHSCLKCQNPSKCWRNPGWCLPVAAKQTVASPRGSQGFFKELKSPGPAQSFEQLRGSPGAIPATPF